MNLDLLNRRNEKNRMNGYWDLARKFLHMYRFIYEHRISFKGLANFHFKENNKENQEKNCQSSGHFMSKKRNK